MTAKERELIEMVLYLNGFETIKDAIKEEVTCWLPIPNEPIYNGHIIDNIALDDDGALHFWAGNLDTDKYATEILVADCDREKLCSEILELI